MSEHARDFVVAWGWSLHGAGPAYGEGLGIEFAGVGRRGVPVEVDLLVGANDGGRAGQRIVVEVLAFEALDVGALSHAELSARDDDRCVFGIGRALRVEDLCGGELLNDAVDREDWVFGNSVVVALNG